MGGAASRKHTDHRCHLGTVSERSGLWGQFFPKIPCFPAVILQHTPTVILIQVHEEGSSILKHLGQF